MISLFFVTCRDAEVGTKTAEPGGTYEYVQDTGLFVGIHRGKFLSIGKLDAAGNFIPDKRWLNLTGGFSAVPVDRFLNASSIKRLKLETNGHIVVKIVVEPVYEYRSGTLIRGIIDDEGDFIPDVGSTVIDFKDYKYSSRAPRIYNLPGKFVQKQPRKAK